MRRIYIYLAAVVVFLVPVLVTHAQMTNVLVHHVKTEKPNYQLGETVKGEFTLSNLGTVPQSDIIYTISSGPYNPKTRLITSVEDSVTHAENPLYIKANSKDVIPFSYVLPNTVVGPVGIKITASLRDGLPIAMDTVQVVVKGETVNRLVPEKGSFIIGDMEAPVPQDSVPVSYAGEKVTYRFSFADHEGSYDLVPVLTLYKWSKTSGEVVARATYPAIKSSQERIEIDMPEVATPDVYAGVLSFESKDGVVVSPAEMSYSLGGELATLNNVVLSALSAKKGDKIAVDVKYMTPLIDMHRTGLLSVPESVSFSIAVKNEKGEVIGTISEQVDLSSTMATFYFNAEKSAKRLSFEAEFKNASGKVLDVFKKELPSEDDVAHQESYLSVPTWSWALAGGLALLLLVLIGLVYLKHKRKTFNNLPIAVVGLMFLGVLSLFGNQFVSASPQGALILGGNMESGLGIQSVLTPDPTIAYQPGDSFNLRFLVNFAWKCAISVQYDGTQLQQCRRQGNAQDIQVTGDYFGYMYLASSPGTGRIANYGSSPTQSMSGPFNVGYETPAYWGRYPEDEHCTYEWSTCFEKDYPSCTLLSCPNEAALWAASRAGSAFRGVVANDISQTSPSSHYSTYSDVGYVYDPLRYNTPEACFGSVCTYLSLTQGNGGWGGYDNGDREYVVNENSPSGFYTLWFWSSQDRPYAPSAPSGQNNWGNIMSDLAYINVQVGQVAPQTACPNLTGYYWLNNGTIYGPNNNSLATNYVHDGNGNCVGPGGEICPYPAGDQRNPGIVTGQTCGCNNEGIVQCDGSCRIPYTKDGGLIPVYSYAPTNNIFYTGGRVLGTTTGSTTWPGTGTTTGTTTPGGGWPFPPPPPLIPQPEDPAISQWWIWTQVSGTCAQPVVQCDVTPSSVTLNQPVTVTATLQDAVAPYMYKWIVGGSYVATTSSTTDTTVSYTYSSGFATSGTKWFGVEALDSSGGRVSDSCPVEVNNTFSCPPGPDPEYYGDSCGCPSGGGTRQCDGSCRNSSGNIVPASCNPTTEPNVPKYEFNPTVVLEGAQGSAGSCRLTLEAYNVSSCVLAPVSGIGSNISVPLTSSTTINTSGNVVVPVGTHRLSCVGAGENAITKEFGTRSCVTRPDIRES